MKSLIITFQTGKTQPYMILTLFISYCFEFKLLQHVREIEICFKWNQCIDMAKKIRQITHEYSSFKIKATPNFASKYEKLTMILSADRILPNCSLLKSNEAEALPEIIKSSMYILWKNMFCK